MFKNLLTKKSPFYCFSRRGFEAVRNTSIESDILQGKNQKIDALIDVILSLNNKQLSYLNQLQAKRNIHNGQTVSINKIYSLSGQRHTPLQFVYQNQWIKKNWKQTHLLTTVLISEDQQDTAKDEEQVVKEIWQIELTSVDASQKIKIIKVLRQMFGLGLKQAKQIADKTPSLIKRQRKEEAQKIKQLLQKQGCVITLK